LSDKKISIIATLHFDVIVRRVMALSLERRNLFSCQIAQNERWEVVPTSKVFLPNVKVAVVAVAIVAARRQRQWQLRQWRRCRQWARIGGESGRQ
jgi:hypothetical protein